MKRLQVVVPALLCVSVLALTGCGKKADTDAAMKTAAPEESLDTKGTGISEGGWCVDAAQSQGRRRLQQLVGGPGAVPGQRRRHL